MLKTHNTYPLAKQLRKSVLVYTLANTTKHYPFMFLAIKQVLEQLKPNIPPLNDNQEKQYQRERYKQNIRFCLLLGWGAFTFEFFQSLITLLEYDYNRTGSILPLFSVAAFPLLLAFLGKYYHSKKSTVQSKHRYLLTVTTLWLCFAAIEDTLRCTAWYCDQHSAKTFIIGMFIFFGALVLKRTEAAYCIFTALFVKFMASLVVSSQDMINIVIELLACLTFFGGFYFKSLLHKKLISYKILNKRTSKNESHINENDDYANITVIDQMSHLIPLGISKTNQIWFIKVINYICESYRIKIKVYDLEKKFENGRKGAVAERFQEIGITASEFIKKVRIEKSKQLLLEKPNAPIKQIAYAMGYEHSNFSKNFREVTHLTPKEFREQNATNPNNNE